MSRVASVLALSTTTRAACATRQWGSRMQSEMVSVGVAWTTAPVGGARLKITAKARVHTSIFRWTINHYLASRFRTSKKYSPLSGRKPTPRSRLCQFAQRSNFSRIIIPSQQDGSHCVNVWRTNELQHGWLRGVGLGSGARRYTRQSGDLLDTFSIGAYDLVDSAIAG